MISNLIRASPKSNCKIYIKHLILAFTKDYKKCTVLFQCWWRHSSCKCNCHVKHISYTMVLIYICLYPINSYKLTNVFDASIYRTPTLLMITWKGKIIRTRLDEESCEQSGGKHDTSITYIDILLYRDLTCVLSVWGFIYYSVKGRISPDLLTSWDNTYPIKSWCT